MDDLLDFSASAESVALPSPTDSHTSQPSSPSLPSPAASLDLETFGTLDLASIMADLDGLLALHPPTTHSAPLHDHAYAATQKTTVATDTKKSSQSAQKIKQPKVPSEEKYRERRDKNNIASKRSRYTRKQKFLTQEMEAEELERENAELKAKISQLEVATKVLREAVFHKLVGRGQSK